MYDLPVVGDARLAAERMTLETLRKFHKSARAVKTPVFLASLPDHFTLGGGGGSDALTLLENHRQWVMPAQVVRNRLHDVHLVATALTHKIPILVTLNGADFAAFASQLLIRSPRELL